MIRSSLALSLTLATFALACGDKGDDTGTTDGADGASDGADGASDGADGASDGADGASDGADGTSDDAPTPVASMNTVTVNGVVFPLMDNGAAPCASDSYFFFSAAFGDTSLYFSLTAQYLNETDPPSGRYSASEMLWNLRGSDASWGTPDDTTDVYILNEGGGVYELIWNDMTTNLYGEPTFTTSGWVRCEL